MNLDVKNLRYILFLIDSKIKDHDGQVFASYLEAKEYAQDAFNEKFCDKAVIGVFQLDPNVSNMHISMIETIGFTGDKKDVNQLSLFQPYSTG